MSTVTPDTDGSGPAPRNRRRTALTRMTRPANQIDSTIQAGRAAVQ
jgi:hypothetical protein